MPVREQALLAGQVQPQRLRDRSVLVELLLQFALVGASALIYFGVRGLTEGSRAAAVRHGYDVLHLEDALGIDWEEAGQDLVVGSRILTTLANWVYIWGHWPVIGLTLLWLHRRHRRDYLLLRNAMFVSGAIGLVIFALYPVAPPRLMPAGFVDTVTNLSHSYRVLQPPQLTNKYAALPSLHVGWNLLVGIFLFRVGRRPILRVVGVASPALMMTAVVVTANHYVIDGIVGSALALVGLAVSYGLWGVLYERGRFGGAFAAVGPGQPGTGHGGDEAEVVGDHAGHPPGGQLAGSRRVDHRPGEHLAARRQLTDDPRGQQPFVDDDTIGCDR